MTRTIRAPRGTQLTCKNWLIEAAYRMIQNNLDPEVAFDPEHLIVYGGRGKAARNWECFDAILESLRELEPDETLLVQSGKPVAVFRTHEDAPRVLIANSNIVPHWATQENFDRWEAEGLIMFGQMTAGSWIYIGTQGILQGTYETFGSLARQQGWGSLKGKLVLTAGLGEMGGAQPLAVTMNEGVALVVEVDPWRIERRLEHRYLDVATDNLEEAMTWAEEARRNGEAKSIGLLGNAAEVLPELVTRGVIPDVVTDQTSAHDPLMGYIPAGLTPESAAALRESDRDAYLERAMAGMAAHVEAMLAFSAPAASCSTTATTCASAPIDYGVQDAFDYPGFVPAFIRPLFCEGSGPFRWVALSGDPADIYETDRIILELFPENEHLRRWITLAQERVAWQGLPARDLLAEVRRTRPSGAGLQPGRSRGPGFGADRDRARPPRRRQRRQPEPRDGRDARRLRCHLRLADPQRADQRGGRRNVGQLPPRGRRGHRLQPARGAGDRRRRHGRRRRPAGARADHRPGHGHRPPRRRRLPGSHCRSATRGCEDTDGGGVDKRKTSGTGDGYDPIR